MDSRNIHTGRLYEIEIVIDENKLTAQQQEQARKFWGYRTVDHPLSDGIEELQGSIEQMEVQIEQFILQHFRYLEEGQKAVTKVVIRPCARIY